MVIQIKKNNQRAQATMEFAMVIAIIGLLFGLVVPIIRLVFDQKSSDIHARVDAYSQFNHGNFSDGLNLDGVYLPDMNHGLSIPEIPDINFPDIGLGALGGLAAGLGFANLMDFMGFGTPDGILGNAFYQSGVAYTSSGFNPEAAKGGAIAGGIGSAQFGRLADSVANDLTGGDFLEFSDPKLQENWGAKWVDGAWSEGLSFHADMIGNFTQGALLGYYTSDGDWKATLMGGAGSALQTGALQDRMLSALGGNEFYQGVSNGALNGGMQILGGAENPWMTLGTSMAAGGFSSAPVQSRVGQGFLGSGVNGAFAGAMAFVQSGGKDATPIYMGAAMSMGAYSINYLDQQSGFQDWRNDKKEQIQEKGREVMDATGVTAARENIEAGIDTARTTVQETFSNNPSEPTDISNHEASVTQAQNDIRDISAVETAFGYGIALSMIAVAMLPAADDRTNQDPATAQTPAPESGTQTAVASTSTTNDSLPPVSPLAKPTNPSGPLTPNFKTANLQTKPPVALRMPQDVNIGALRSSVLAENLKSHRNQAVTVLKYNLSQRFISSYRQQLVHQGFNQQRIQAKLADPSTREKIEKITNDPRLLAEIDAMVEMALSDETFLTALKQAQGDLTKLQALLVNLSERAKERGKTSKQNVYTFLPEKSLKQKLWDKLVTLSATLGEFI